MNPLLLTGLFDIGKSLLERFFPDPEKKAAALLQLETMRQTGELAELAAATDLAKLQIQTNIEEAKSTNLFVSGWRPAVGWAGAFGLAYAALFEPFLRFGASTIFGYTGEFPVIDTTITMQVLFGILGLGAMRSYDKKVGNGHEKDKM